ncbi:MAG: zinc-binding alcohol dehydrogenase [Methylacidiphilales bacterium]|nr:zinc-binding alcohol dehydrogenase [Candidatus Methylacidiphilales bacterium]
MKTQALVFPEPGKVELREIDLPTPTPRDIVIDVVASGVSVGTERWTYLGKRAEIAFPNVPGYMGIGRIIEAGPEAISRGYKVGDMVNFIRSRLAGELEGKSWMSSHLARAVVDVFEDAHPNPEQLDVHHCEKLPQGLDPFDAALTGLGSVALRGMEMAGIPVGTRVLVVGLGVIGQFAAQICRLKGARVAVADIVTARLEKARENGADWVINSGKENLAERAREIAPNGFDIIIDTSSSPAVVNSLFPLLRRRGKFVFQGWYPPPSALDLNAFHGRLPTCYFPCAHSGPAVQAAMQWVRDGHLKVRNLVTHRVKPRDAAEIYRQIGAGSEGFLGVIFDWKS